MDVALRTFNQWKRNNPIPFIAQVGARSDRVSGSTVNKEPAARLRSVSEAPVDKALTLWVDIVGCLIQKEINKQPTYSDNLSHDSAIPDWRIKKDIILYIMLYIKYFILSHGFYLFYFVISFLTSFLFDRSKTLNLLSIYRVGVCACVCCACACIISIGRLLRRHVTVTWPETYPIISPNVIDLRPAPSAWHRSCPSQTPDCWGQGEEWGGRGGEWGQAHLSLKRRLINYSCLRYFYQRAIRVTPAPQNPIPLRQTADRNGINFSRIEWKKMGRSLVSKSYDSFAWQVQDFVRCFCV